MHLVGFIIRIYHDARSNANVLVVSLLGLSSCCATICFTYCWRFSSLSTANVTRSGVVKIEYHYFSPSYFMFLLFNCPTFHSQQFYIFYKYFNVRSVYWLFAWRPAVMNPLFFQLVDSIQFNSIELYTLSKKYCSSCEEENKLKCL